MLWVQPKKNPGVVAALPWANAGDREAETGDTGIRGGL